MSIEVTISHDVKVRSARIIQRCWRRWVNMAPYRWCRAMLNHAEHSDTPHKLLQLISPADSNILDSASGVRVRLRLGVHRDQDGEKLAVFYKLFTSRPIVDLCASSPRDYTAPSAKQPNGIHTRGGPEVPDLDSKEGWYSRAENNPWRVVAWDALRSTAGMVAQAKITNQRVKDFRYSIDQRRESRAQSKKLKRRRWMTNLYLNKALFSAEKSKIDEQIKNVIINRENGDFEHNQSEIDDFINDELISWAKNLDFDDYQDNWINLITLPKI